MKVSDYIVDELHRQGVTHFFGYQGTMIAHLVDSIGRNPATVNHSCCHEQGAAFAACGYAKASGNLAVAYATSGPGAVNLLSGVADAWYDSAPVLFLTGQLNTNEYTEIPALRQQGFQETDIVAMAAPITKYARQIRDAREIPAELKKACAIALEGRRGPVLLDLPMNVQRQEIPAEISAGESGEKAGMSFAAAKCGDADTSIKLDRKGASIHADIDAIAARLYAAARPVLLLGNGISKRPEDRALVREVVEALGIPVVTSMLGRDLLPADHPLNFGMLGSGYGHRYANLIVCKKADYILSVGNSLCPRQTGMNPDAFAPGAALDRVDIDEIQLRRRAHGNERRFRGDAMAFFRAWKRKMAPQAPEPERADAWARWLTDCTKCKEKLMQYDETLPELRENRLMERLSRLLPDGITVLSDVGQHQVWTATSFLWKEKQRFLCSGGHGAMGFSIPAAIGAFYATGKPAVVLCGDGSAQMNIQELEWIRREQIPVKIFVFQNRGLGLIYQQQDSLFAGRYTGALPEGGYSAPDFTRVAKAYGLDAFAVEEEALLSGGTLPALPEGKPCLIEVRMREMTQALPKTVFGEPMYRQKPYLPEKMMEELTKL